MGSQARSFWRCWRAGSRSHWRRQKNGPKAQAAGQEADPPPQQQRRRYGLDGLRSKVLLAIAAKERCQFPHNKAGSACRTSTLTCTLTLLTCTRMRRFHRHHRQTCINFLHNACWQSLCLNWLSSSLMLPAQQRRLLAPALLSPKRQRNPNRRRPTPTANQRMANQSRRRPTTTHKLMLRAIAKRGGKAGKSTFEKFSPR